MRAFNTLRWMMDTVVDLTKDVNLSKWRTYFRDATALHH